MQDSLSTDFDNWYLYVVVNRDLDSMTHGKAQAHSGHAASQFVYYMYKMNPDHLAFKHWLGEDGFGTQINLKVTDDWEMYCEDIEVVARDQGYHFGWVIDPTYPYEATNEMLLLMREGIHTTIPNWNPKRVRWSCTRKEKTAFWIFCDKTDPKIKNVLKYFRLHP